MTTLTQYRREMHLRSRHATGRTVSPSSFTTDTIVVNALATGTIGAGKFSNKWLLRADAATAAAADRVRYSTDSGFAASTGTLTHAGTNYADTTVGTELVEICEYEPYLLDDAIDITIRSLMRSDRTEFPTRQGVTRYWMNDLTWITGPSDVQRVCVKHTPVLSRNRFFDKWNGVNSSGVLTSDHWTLAGASATYARSTTQVRTGQYSAAITRSGTDATLTQTVGLLNTGAESLVGQTVQGVAVVWSAVASQVRVRVSDGVTTTNSSYHTGGSGWEEITTAVVTVGATATNLTVAVSVEGSNTVCYVDDCYLVFGSVNDSVRRDDYPEAEIEVGWDQGAGTLAMITPTYAYGSQIVVYSLRPYPGFDSTRLAAGTADADEQDAPLAHVVLGALWRLYDGLAEDDPDMRTRADRWRAEFETAAVPLLEDKGDGRDGLPLPSMQFIGGGRF